MVRKDKIKKNKPLASLLVVSYLLSFLTIGYSQNSSLWIPASASVAKLTDSQHVLPKGQVYELNKASLQATLLPISEKEVKEVSLQLPYPNGELKTFLIQEASILPDKLTHQFPSIRSFKGVGIDDPTAYARLSWTPHGLQGIILSATAGTIYVDPIEKFSSSYKSYYKKDVVNDSFLCSVKDHSNYRNNNSATIRNAGDCTLRTYRLAIACTGEYTQFHGGSLADAVAAINTSVTRINAVFEKEVAITFQLVENLTDILFVNPNTDPFDGVSAQGGFNEVRLLDQTSSTITNLIGIDNFDVGHLFFTGGGGSAALGSVCDNAFKAEGISGLPNPEGPQFDIDFVAHEIGHQFGADHTFSGDSGSCFRQGVNHAAVEPGSGTTIMSYAGLCEEQNVETRVGAYFHARSLQQISDYIQGSGNRCAEVSDLSKEPPIASAGNNYFIPRGTPFVLTGAANESSTSLSYTWEQMDNGMTTQPPLSTARTGPLFRSYPPSASPQRYFPNLADLTNNRTSDWEVLPAVERVLNFRFTVRDNDPNGGCSAEDDVRLQVDGNSGPFEVVETGFDNWTVGEVTTIEWNVAGTTNTPINAPFIDIYLSTDGGLSFPHLVIENIPNTGSAEIFVPNLPSATARVMVKGHDQIFFDINNQDFEIVAVLDDIVVEVPQTIQSVCNSQEAAFSIEVGVSGAVSGAVTVSTNGLPEGIEAMFSNTTFIPPRNSTLTLTNLSNLPIGTYDFELLIESEKGIQKRDLQLIIVEAASNKVALQTPENNSFGQTIFPTFEWVALAGATNYTFQLSTTPDFETILVERVIATNSIEFDEPIEFLTRYYWRVLPDNECASNNPAIYTFTTFAAFCKEYESSDVPMTIRPIANESVVSTINIPEEGILLDINVKELDIKHSWIQDLSIHLNSPLGTRIYLTREVCGIGQADLFLTFDDDAPGSYLDIPCPPTTGETFKGIEPLDFYIGEPINGPWSLVVDDPYDADGGSLNDWSLEVCYLDLQVKPALTYSFEKQDETCFGSKDGAVSVFPIDGQGDYTFQWSNGAETATQQNLAPGSYTVTISDEDTSLVETVNVLAAFPIDVNFSNSVSICPNTQTGFITTEGNLAGLTFEWSTGDTSPSLTELKSGLYSVTITNSIGCSQIKEFNIGEDLPIQATLSKKDVSCHGKSDGSIEIEVVDDRFLDYVWSDGSRLSFLDQVNAGEYEVTITTAGDCREVFSATINEPSPFTLSSSIQEATCFGDTSLVSLQMNGGIPPFDISCNNPLDNCTEFLEGTYQFVVTDSMGCSITEEVIITIPSEIKIQFSTTNPSSLNAQDGMIQLEVSGGTSPYTYQWSSGDTTQNVSRLAAGSYSVTIVDNVGCTKIDTINVSNGPCYNLAIEFSFEHPNCLGEGLGSILAVPMNGTGPFNYSWNTEDTLAQLNGLAPGAYEVTITDALGCFGTNAQTLIPESDISIDLESNVSYSCLNNSFGSLEVIASGGVGEVTYLWDNGKQGALIDSLQEGTYSVTVSDEVGCTKDQAYVVGNTDTLVRPLFVDQLELILDTSGLIKIEASMLLISEVNACSVNEIQYSKLNFDCGNIGQRELIVTTQFTDATSEMTVIPVLVSDTIAPLITCPNDTEIEHCFEDKPIEYELSTTDNCGMPILEKIRGLESGASFPVGTTRVTYEATDAGGNTSQCDFTVTLGTGSNITIGYAVPEGILVDSLEDPILISAILSCVQDDFSTAIKPSGGTPPYKINVIPNLAETIPFFLIEVRDSNNCTLRETIEMPITGIPTRSIEPLAEIKDATENQNNGSITIETLEGESIVKYEWYFQDSLIATTNNIEDLSAGEYQLVLTDLIGCTYEFQYTVGTLTSTNIIDILQRQISIAPNPTNGMFSIKSSLSNNRIQLIELFSLDGSRLPLSIPTMPFQKEWLIDLQHFSSGLYLVKIHTDKGVLLKRVALL